jgi:hypothetical protein
MNFLTFRPSFGCIFIWQSHTANTRWAHVRVCVTAYFFAEGARRVLNRGIWSHSNAGNFNRSLYQSVVTTYVLYMKLILKRVLFLENCSSCQRLTRKRHADPSLIRYMKHITKFSNCTVW